MSDDDQDLGQSSAATLRGKFRDALEGLEHTGPAGRAFAQRQWERHTIQIDRRQTPSLESRAFAEAERERSKAPAFFWGVVVGTVIGILLQAWYSGHGG